MVSLVSYIMSDLFGLVMSQLTITGSRCLYTERLGSNLGINTFMVEIK